MPRKCCIRQYSNSHLKVLQSNKVSFHSFPSNDNLCKDWFHVIKLITGQELTDRQKLKICSSHFLESDLSKVGEKFLLNRLAMPCIFPNLEHTNYEVLSLSAHEESVDSTHIADEIDDIKENTVQERVLHKTNDIVEWSIKPEQNDSVDGMEVDIASSMSSADNEFEKSIPNECL